MLAGILDATRFEIVNAAHHGLIKADEKDPRRGTMYMQRGGLALTPVQYRKFVERFEALLEQFHSKEPTTDDEAPRQKYGFTVLIHPVTDSKGDQRNHMEGKSHGGTGNE